MRSCDRFSSRLRTGWLAASATPRTSLRRRFCVEVARQAPSEVTSPRAWLSTVVTRLSIDHLRSARVRREEYVGEWLPEPLVTEFEDPVEFADSISQAFLVLLESLSPVERGVLLLRDVFDLSFSEIAEIVDKTEDNRRQLAVHARRRVDERKPRFAASRERREELAGRFFAAYEEGDLEGLTEILAADVVLHGDDGGKAPALSRPVYGRERVAGVLVNLVASAQRLGLELRRLEINGQPGAAFFNSEGQLVNVVSLDVADHVVQTVRSIVNPDKLRHLGPTADLKQILRAGVRRAGSGASSALEPGQE